MSTAKNKVALRVENVSKRYRIGAPQEQHDTVANAVAAMLKTPLRNYRRYKNLYDFRDKRQDGSEAEDVIWALRDVSFEVGQGEVVGLVGLNGAGKSTLLKVLSRITPPTGGRIEISGRVSSLLEVGTGFHPELTGRENVYLNGTILGMRKREVDSKFDEIVDFSGVEKFLDTPVKRYSSGMRVRLAFAVAAHLEPEILIVDEVLAVGDAAFQKKCLNKMEDVGKGGRTVLFVSHNMNTVSRLCPRALLLQNGRITHDGPTQDVVADYLSEQNGASAVREWSSSERAPGNAKARLRQVRVADESGNAANAVDIRRPVALEMEFEVQEPSRLMLPHFQFYNEEGVYLFKTVDVDPEWRRRVRPEGRYTSRAWIPGNLLAEGRIFVAAGVCLLEPVEPLFFKRDVVAFNVVDSLDGDSARGDWSGRMDGALRPLLQWETEFEPPLERAVRAG